MTHAELSKAETNVELLRAALLAFNRNDLDACLALMRPDFIINLAGVPYQMHGHAVWRQGAEVMRTGFPDIQLEIEDIFASGDRVAVRLIFRGTHTGEFQGIVATGRPIEYTSIEIYRVSQGLIAEEWICSDMATLMQQIGGPASDQG